MLGGEGGGGKRDISFTRKVDVISVLNTGHLFRVFRAHTLLNNFNLSHPNILGKYIIQEIAFVYINTKFEVGPQE